MGDMLMSVIIRIVLLLVLAMVFSGGVSCSKGKDAAAKATGKDAPAQTSVPPNPISPVPSIGTTPSAEIKGEPGQPQTVDVISGKPIVKSFFADYNGERVYFCCANSKNSFQQKADWYLQKIKEKNIILDKTPAGQ
jgi:YHS domain-containing protein